MSILNLFKKVDPQKVFDLTAEGVDKLFFTQEEKSDASKKAFDQWLEWYKMASDENTARSITRRYLAIMFVVVFLLLIIAAAITYPISSDYSNFIWELSKTIAPYTGGVSLFYFGYYGIKSIVKTKNTQS